VKNITDKKILQDEGILLVERSIQTQKKDQENFIREPFRRLGDSLIYIF
jgi:hypothetical protein